MKKLLAILLATTMLLMSFPAFAEGSTTDKAITFLNFSFGDTFSNIRSSERIYTIRFKTEMLSPRNMAEAFWRVAEWQQLSDTLPMCFSVDFSTRSVAGHECNPSLFFMYPVENGSPVLNEGEAICYAGVYEFHGDDAKGIFDDLTQKLTKLYGEPYSVGKTIDNVFGAPTLTEDQQRQYAEQVEWYDPSYVVWVSSANNAALVLKYYKVGDHYEETKLDYISFDAVEIFNQIEMNVDNGSSDDSMEGL